MSNIQTGLLLLAVVLSAASIFISRTKSPSVESASDGIEQLKGELKALEERFFSEQDRTRESVRSMQADSFRLVQERIDKLNEKSSEEARLSRQDAANGRQVLEQSITTTLDGIKLEVKSQGETNERRLTEIRETIQKEMEKLRSGNEEKLEKMRETVDEKLQGTLEKRIGESFKQVSEHLEAVQNGLGEMRSLATGVGDLKRVLTNVKSRGGWGEVQLGRQLEDMLTKDQFEKNVTLRIGSQESVEYAIKLPGRIQGEFVYLPIDAKFPQEDYERLLIAQEQGAIDEIEAASKEIEKKIKAEAEKIHDKYINPPFSTEFAILYLPTEGLFAEVIRRPGLCYELQNKFRVLVTGPTTLMAILNSLQMGFKTLAIEKSTSEVWKVLAAVKHEFQKYSGVWQKLDKQLSTAQSTVQKAAIRTRTLERSLRDVENLPIDGLGNVLQLSDFTIAEDPEDDEENADE
jgi:DNA recombination protein RmuC